MKINHIITIDPGLDGGIARWTIDDAGENLHLVSCRLVNTVKGPFCWPNNAVRAQEQKMLAALDGVAIKPTTSLDVFKDREEAYRPDRGRRIHSGAVLEGYPEGHERILVVCERPATGQSKFTTAQTIASTAASEALLVTEALELGHPVISVTPSQWQGEILGESTEKGDSKIRALRALQELRPDLLPMVPGWPDKPHDGVVDAIVLGLWVRDQLPTIKNKLAADDGHFRYPFPAYLKPVDPRKQPKPPKQAK